MDAQRIRPSTVSNWAHSTLKRSDLPFAGVAESATPAKGVASPDEWFPLCQGYNIFARSTRALETQEYLLREEAALDDFTSKVSLSLTPLLCLPTN